MKPTPDETPAGTAAHGGGDDGGFVLVWFSLMLVVMVGMAGFGVDVWNWWYTGQQTQRAADSGALAGVVFMPGSLPNATTTAVAATQANGFTSAQTAVANGTKSNQLKVTVTETVENGFVSIFGMETTTIRRDATAEYVGRVAMGSPINKLGRDPTSGWNPDHWVSVSGATSTKQGGDRYQSREKCMPAQPAYMCPGTGQNNPEYEDDGYVFVVRMSERPSAAVNIQIFDPAFVPMDDQDCGEADGADTRLPFGYALSGISDDWSDYTRYDDPVASSGAYKPYCVGDVASSNANKTNTTGLIRPLTAAGVNGNPNQVATYIVREPDFTPNDDFTNTKVSGCAVQYAPWTVTNTNGYYDLLNNDDTGANNRNGEAAQFHSEFRQWVQICSIPRATARAWYDEGRKDIIVQALSNAPWGNVDGRTSAKDGRNHFSIRAGYGAGLGGDVDVFANGRLPMHAAANRASTLFYVAKIGPENVGRKMSLIFYDVGDAAATGTITIQKPPGYSGSGWACTRFKRLRGDTGAEETIGSPPSCALTGVNSSSGYQGSVVEATITIPNDYTCVLSDTESCWVKVEFKYPLSGGGVSDHTVWEAGVIGDPVRLVE